MIEGPFSTPNAFAAEKPSLVRARDYFLAAAAGEVAAVAAPSSIPKVQCVSTFLPAGFCAHNYRARFVAQLLWNLI